jgi:signal transduction histidine kinase
LIRVPDAFDAARLRYPGGEFGMAGGAVWWAGLRRARNADDFAIAIGLALALCPAAAAAAEPGVESRLSLFGLTLPDLYGPAGIAVFLGVVVFATVTAILYIRERGRWLKSKSEASTEIERLRADADRAELLLGAEPQFVVSLSGAAEPTIVGDATRVTGGPGGRRALVFGSWVQPRDAAALDAAVADLGKRGERFNLTVTSLSNNAVEVEGRPVAGRAVIRFRDVGPERTERLKVEAQLEEARAALAASRTILDALPHPAWLKNQTRGLVWVNSAYIHAVEATSREDAVRKSADILDARQRLTAEREIDRGGIFHHRGPMVIGGRRAVLDAVEVIGPQGGGGLAVDMTELDQVRSDLERQMQSHVGTLDQLPTAVAIFDQAQRLTFSNQAYRLLWGLEPRFLDSHPSDGEVLEQLRTLRRLPEQANFQEWKRQFLDAYRSLENRETWWHLPDGRTLRVVIRPNPQGGVTYLFDDVSERVELQSKYNELMKVRRETLDALKEGVFVFSTDGRLKLFNRAVAKMWKLPREVLKLKPHIDEIVRLARILAPDVDLWANLKATIAGVTDQRTGFHGRIVRRDESTIDCFAAPLPDGATLVTFTDVTAGVQAEKALKERNEALEKAGRLRNDFIHNVSYELRSPLTTIIGFAQLLDDPRVGPLMPRQIEYIDHIKRSSAALLTLINDILDLQTIDYGDLELSIGPVDVREVIGTVRDGVQDRLAEARIALDVDVADDVRPIEADGKRLRQVVFNLLTNAIGFSEAGQTVRIAAMADDDHLVLTVADQGRGIPQDQLARVFDRFESHTRGTRHRGMGLGLSLVRSFVEAHGGEVTIASEPGKGTIVTCKLPHTARIAPGGTRTEAIETDARTVPNPQIREA